MSQPSQPGNLDPGRTLIGLEPVDASGTRARVRGVAGGHGLDVRVGRTGNLFEIEGGAPGRRLLLKVFPWAVGLPAGVVQTFTEESSIVANLRHPHVVPITNAGRLDDGTVFAIVERLRGQTLDERLQQRGALAPDEVLSIVRSMASALSVAHAAGVIHRELRADNVFIEEQAAHRNGFPRLLDFGVARLSAAARAAGRVVHEGATEVAPELRRDHGEAADHRADQFALAALAFLLLHGTAVPYGTPGAPAFRRLWGHPAHWEGMNAPSTPALDAVLARATSWRAENRFDSVASFFCAFEEAWATRPAPMQRLALAADRLAVAPPPAAPQAPLQSVPVQPAPGSPHGVVALAKPVEPAKPADAARVARDAPTVVRPAPAAVVAAPRAVAAPLGSLTQQFFAEGDRLEAATALQVQRKARMKPAADDDDNDRDEGNADEDADQADQSARSGTFELVPRRRAPLIGAVALGVVALAIIAHAAVTATRDGGLPWAGGWAAAKAPAPGTPAATTSAPVSAASAGAAATTVAATRPDPAIAPAPAPTLTPAPAAAVALAPAPAVAPAPAIAPPPAPAPARVPAISPATAAAAPLPIPIPQAAVPAGPAYPRSAVAKRFTAALNSARTTAPSPEPPPALSPLPAPPPPPIAAIPSPGPEPAPPAPAAAPAPAPAPETTSVAPAESKPTPPPQAAPAPSDTAGTAPSDQPPPAPPAQGPI